MFICTTDEILNQKLNVSTNRYIATHYPADMEHIFVVMKKLNTEYIALQLATALGIICASFFLMNPLNIAAADMRMLPKASLMNEAHVENTKTLLVHFAPDTSELERQRILADVDGKVIDWIESIDVAVVLLQTDSQSDVSGQSILGESSAVEYVEADGWVYGTYESDDPDLYDTDRVYTAELLNLFEAWNYTVGDPDIVIAVLDTGIAFEHPEFADKILPGYDFFNKDDDPTDDHGHGTHVAGTSAARIDNGIGTAGVCGKCSILPVKVLNENNSGTWSGVAAGVTYAADEGANIIVMSLGSVAGTRTIEEAINYAVEKGVLIVAAAGNINSNKDFFPAAYPGVIGVSATEKSNLRWSLSNYGDYVDISAPGHLIYGTHKDLDNLYDGHLFMSGTSMATPHVAGLAGLLWSQDPSRSREEVENLLLGTALDLGDPGRDKYFGAGRIDPLAALSIGASSQSTAQISGSVWKDTNADGLQDESVRVPDALVELKDLVTNNVVVARANSRGFWQADQLPAGNYQIRVIGTVLIPTTEEANVTLTEGKAVTHIDFGLVSKLPDTVLGDIQMKRVDSKITLTWEIKSELISTLTVERAVDGGQYEVVGQDVLGTARVESRARNEFVDILPSVATDSAISYRFLIEPGESYIEGGVVSPGNTTYASFIPFLAK